MIKEGKRISEAASENQTQRTSDTVTKRIGSTVYRLKIRFSTEAKETMEDKILRMVKNEVSTNSPDCGSVELPQTKRPA